MKITILGCGSSGGVPLITGDWGECAPHNTYNRRRRVSILIQHQNLNILIDTSPDLRQQLLDARVSHVDTVLYTHGHADHGTWPALDVGQHALADGLHELRYYKQKDPIPVYGDYPTLEVLKKAFDYAFKANNPLYAHFLTAHIFENMPFNVQGIEVIPIPLDHVTLTTWGFRIGNFAYTTDFKSIPEASLAKLKDLDLWIVDCLSFEEHPTHSSFNATQELIRKCKPKQAILTHMNHFMDYDVVLSRCDDGVIPAHDGMVVILPTDTSIT